MAQPNNNQKIKFSTNWQMTNYKRRKIPLTGKNNIQKQFIDQSVLLFKQPEKIMRRTYSPQQNHNKYLDFMRKTQINRFQICASKNVFVFKKKQNQRPCKGILKFDFEKKSLENKQAVEIPKLSQRNRFSIRMHSNCSSKQAKSPKYKEKSENKKVQKQLIRKQSIYNLQPWVALDKSQEFTNLH